MSAKRTDRLGFGTAILLLIVLSGWYVFRDAGRPLFQGDEFLYAGEVTEMLTSGDAFTPRLHGRPILQNPPLFLWLTLPFAAAVPTLPAALRILPGLCFLALLMLLYRMGAGWRRPGMGVLAAAIFALTYDHLHNHGYRSVGSEALLNLELGLIWWLLTGVARKPARLRWVGALTGAVFITKTAYVVFPLLLIALALWMEHGNWRPTKRLLAESALLAVLVALPWYVAISAIHGGGAVWECMAVFHVWHRALGDTAVAARAGESFGRGELLYVLQHFLVYAQPWALLIWPALAWCWGTFRRTPDRMSMGLRLAAAWFLAVLGAFLLSRGRWCWYISSAYIPASMLIAAYLASAARGALKSVWVIAALTAASGALLPVPLAHNPYAVAASHVPLDHMLPTQLLLAALLLVLCYDLQDGSPKDRQAPVRWLNRAAPALMALAAAGCVAAAFRRPAALPTDGWQAAALGAAVVLAGLVLRFGRPAAVGRGAIAALLVIGAGYVSAPLRYDGFAFQRQEITRMDAMIRQGRFARGAVDIPSDLPFYTWMILAQTYGGSYEFQDNPGAGTVTIWKKSVSGEN